MNEPKSPTEKFQMLFYKALKPAAKALNKPFKPSDVAVTIAPLVDPLPYETKQGLQNISIDLSKSPFAGYTNGISKAFLLGHVFAVNDGTIQLRDNPLLAGYGNILGYSTNIQGLQLELARALK
jgi:hypothetical protein